MANVKRTKFLAASAILLANTIPAHAVEFGVFADVTYNDTSKTSGTNAFAMGGDGLLCSTIH